MNSARIFAQHLYSQNPQDSVGLLTLYNYFKNVCDPEAELSAKLFNDFYRKTLSFQHWRKNRQTLGHTVRGAIDSFFRKHKPFETQSILHADQMQVIEVEDINEFVLLTERRLEAQKQSEERIRIKFDAKRNLVAIHLFADGTLRIRQFSPLGYIYNGELLPLFPGMDLYYAANLELAPDRIQHLKIDSFTSLHFTQTATRFTGTTVRGYTLNRLEAMEIDTFKRIPKLFLPLKRIERYFIDPQSDPFYVRLTEDLEKAVQLLNNNHLHAIHYACSVFERGRLAVEEVFPDDKLLTLLVKDLGNTLVIKTQTSAEEIPVERMQVEEKCQKVKALPAATPRAQSTDLLSD
jgi:hypothetical protein